MRKRSLRKRGRKLRSWINKARRVSKRYGFDAPIGKAFDDYLKNKVKNPMARQVIKQGVSKVINGNGLRLADNGLRLAGNGLRLAGNGRRRSYRLPT